ncbi:thioesterase II family protein [Streptomyces sp. 4F14]|uniref:thioesterase II family protein n=1 Tax=Streptomyces sp. 4F14 TaxID=3394380 RepID=UPI003A86486E
MTRRQTAPTRSAWIRAFGPPAGTPLVCFPHAGGAASYFRGWSGPDTIGAEVLAVQYPGRENRIRDPFPPDLHTLADQLTEELDRYLDRPAVFFGHSMGAVIGYEVARRLTADGRGHAVRHLVVSGCGAPHRVRPFAGQEGAHLLDDDRLVALLKELGSGNAGLLDDPDLRSVFLPAVRDDYRIVQSYVPRAGGPLLRTDVTAFVGRQDEAVGVGDAGAWAAATRGRFALRTFPGGHFYLAEQRGDVLRAVAGIIDTGRAE